MIDMLPNVPQYKSWLATATETLSCAGVDSPRLSAELILGHVTNLSRVQLATWPERQILPEQAADLAALLARRAAGEPTAYLIGYREFFGRDFRVNAHTLIPRPETELLVQDALDTLSTTAAVRFADLGTGSGCIAVTLCAERPAWRGVAVDISPDTLAVAASNARSHGVTSRLRLLCADFTRPLLARASLDLIVSNPPYVSTAEYHELSPEVRNFEPARALVPPLSAVSCGETASNGLEHAACVVRAAAEALRPGGVVLIEHGWTQGDAVRVLLENNMWEKAITCRDLAGLDRFVRAKRSATEFKVVW